MEANKTKLSRYGQIKCTIATFVLPVDIQKRYYTEEQLIEFGDYSFLLEGFLGVSLLVYVPIATYYNLTSESLISDAGLSGLYAGFDSIFRRFLSSPNMATEPIYGTLPLELSYQVAKGISRELNKIRRWRHFGG